MTVHTRPQVSVVIPAHNRAELIGDAIDSVLAQSFEDFELIVVDDASTDDTAGVVKRYADPRVRLVSNANNLGIPGSRNHGIEVAHGAYIASLDSDDYAYPKRLEVQAAFLDANPDCGVVGSWTNWMDASGRLLRHKVKRRPANPDDAAAMLIFNSCLAQPSVMARTDLLRRFRYDEQFDMSEDYELWVRMAPHCRMRSLPRVLVCCRAHGNRSTKANARRIEERQRAIYRPQLDWLGMAYSEADLERHQFLPRSATKEGTTDLESLVWAEDWLLRLQAANARVGLYESRAFERVLGWAWAAVCHRTLRVHPRLGFNHLIRSPLSRLVPSSIITQLRMRCSGLWPVALRG